MTEAWGSPAKGSTGLSMPNPQPWAADALCAQIGDDQIWFPSIGNTSSTAIKICHSCPVIEQCRDYALNNPTPLYGIWGGLGARQRDKIRAQRNRGAA